MHSIQVASGLVKFVILEGVIEIKSGAFKKFIKLEEVTLPKIETIEEQMSVDCLALETINLPNTTTMIMK
jgi:hypothetical protein